MRRLAQRVAVLLAWSAAAVAQSAVAARPGPTVAAVGFTVRDLERSLRFYTEVLHFTEVGRRERMGDDEERLQGVFGLRTVTATLRLGEERLELTEFLTPRGRALPEDGRSNDRWFQHVAIVVGDMDRAYAELRRHGVRHVSPAPQTLPAWNAAAAGIRAFYFQDPDGHALEVLQFPPDKGEARWQAKDGALFLGIDHTAIVVADTAASLRAWRDELGFTVVGTAENHGVEQERLNSVFGARLRITTLRGAGGPGVELLEYLAPAGGRPCPRDTAANDLWHWVVTVEVADAVARRVPAVGGWNGVSPAPVRRDGRAERLLHDADGHRALLVTGAAADRPAR